MAGLALLAPPLAAQTRPPGDAVDPIIVTGTLLSEDEPGPQVAVRVLDRRALDAAADDPAEELLRLYPGFVPAMGSAMNNGSTGASYVDLRGLGASRNLVLLDGNRLTPADIDGIFNLSSLPMGVVERVDVLSGGASATYGADAISGVVNFVTRTDLRGVEVRAASGITGRGDGRDLRLGVLAGRALGDRGHLLVAADYQRDWPLRQGSRSFASSDLDSRTGGPGGSPVTVPAIFSSVSDAGGNFISTGCGAATGIPCATTGQGIRQILPDGSAFSGAELYAPYNVNPWNLFRTGFERAGGYASGDYALSDSVSLRLRGLVSHSRVETELAPSGVFGDFFLLPLNQPYLTEAMRQQFCQYDLDPGPGYVPLYSPDECAAAGAATGPFDPAFRTTVAGIARRADEFGPRRSQFTSDYFDVRGGLHGALLPGIDWDVDMSWGKSRNRGVHSGYWRQSNLQQALLSGPDGCFDPSGGCVPVDLFGPDGSVTPAMNSFLAGEAHSLARVSMVQGRGLISGDLGVTAPAARDPLSFAVGAEYRRTHASRQSDLLDEGADLGGVPAGTPDVDGSYSALEGLAELRAPLLGGLPLIEDFTLNASGRISRFRINTANSPRFDATTGTLGASWTVISGLSLQASLARAVRAPNIGELFSPRTTSAASLGFDPCAGAAPLHDGDLRAVCLAQGAQQSQIGAIPAPATGLVNITLAGSPYLKPERANTLTLGVQASPAAIPHLVLAASYYRISVDQAIGTATPAEALAACFQHVSAASAGDAACTAIRRNPATGALDGTSVGIPLPLSNLGRLATNGFDWSLHYRQPLSPSLSLLLDLEGNWTRSARFQSSPAAPVHECAGYFSTACEAIQPRLAFYQQVAVATNNIELALGWRFLGRMAYEPLQQQADLATATALGCRDPQGADPDGCIIDERFRRIGAASYVDASARFAIGRAFTLMLRIDNLLDRQPPVVGSSVGVTSYNSGNTYPATYDPLGRRLLVSGSVRF